MESRDRVGGRVSDDLMNGSIVGRGAQLINGCVNNPFALICHQVIYKSESDTSLKSVFEARFDAGQFTHCSQLTVGITSKYTVFRKIRTRTKFS